MIKTNEINIQPPSVVSYKITKIFLILTLITLPLLFGGVSQWFPFWYITIIIIGIPLSIWAWLDTRAVSFNVDENKIDINWGIIIKKSRTIMTKSIQNIKTEHGLLAGLFGIVIVKIWTASQSQIINNTKDNQNKPDGLLEIKPDDAKWLSEFVASASK